MGTSRLLDHMSPRIPPTDEAFRSRMLAIASGRDDVIALGRGDPDFHSPAHVVAAAKQALDDNQHHYTAPTGLPALRQAIATHLSSDYGLDYASDEIIVTAGVQESIMLAMLGLVQPGDEVLITSPRFTTYDTAVTFCGGVPIPVPTFEKDDFALDIREIEHRITAKTRLFVLVSPNNPTGAVTPPNVIRQIAALAERHDILVIADEIYASLIYPPHEHLSLARLPGMKGRTITLNGFSKTYAMTGWRVGYLAAPRDFVARMTEPRHTLSINTCSISQHAALAALTGPQDEREASFRAYGKRRAYLMEALRAAGFRYGAPGGAFYIYTNVSSSGMKAAAFCETLLRETGVMVFPGDMFGEPDSDFIRISYLQPLDRLQDAMARITAFIDRSRDHAS
ncbi:MAG: pyridoxal phosphate-dependent aminotransferase [Pseudomonadota bacterium]